MDYKKLGFKSGLEIHQQLDTSKLFCSCPSVLRSDKPIFEVERKLHLVAGESGEIDTAAKYQHMEGKTHIYQAHDTTCLVELDEEPPHSINSEALKIATQISLLLNCKMVPISQVMRKTVINGSNTSGFQRTVMIARDGYIETSEGRVGIDSVFLEEDSARKVKENDGKVYWNLDRLGIPLVEITTTPDLKNAKHVKEAAMMIGDILRSCEVRRGIGTIRQDVNISIEGANRVEIKGFQDSKIMEKAVDLEIERQRLYIYLKDNLLKFKQSEILDLTKGISPKLSWMKESLDNGSKFIGFKLPGFEGFLGEIEGYSSRLGKEIAGIAKTRGFGGVIHGDENMSKYKFTDDEISFINKSLDVKKGDSWMMLLGDSVQIKAVLEDLIFPFLSKLKNGNPKEVRNCLLDGETEFIRPMPGAARMYPETDVELLHIGRKYVNEVRKDLPELRSDVEKRLKKEGLSPDMLTILFKRNLVEEFKEISSEIKYPMLVGKALLLLPSEIASKTGYDLEDVEEKLSSEVLIFVLKKVLSNEIDEGDLKEVLMKVVEGEPLERAVLIEKVDMSKVEEFVVKLVKDKPGLRPNAYMGIVMKEFNGKVSPKDVMGIIGKLI